MATFIGTAQNDYIEGTSGDDLLAGLGGNDTVVGGAGVDTVDFRGSPAGVYVNLGAQSALDGFGG